MRRRPKKEPEPGPDVVPNIEILNAAIGEAQKQAAEAREATEDLKQYTKKARAAKAALGLATDRAERLEASLRKTTRGR